MSVTRRSFLKWSSVIPILPGTDVALMLAIAYEWVQAGSYDQQFLNTYCVGFDDEHLPEGAEPGTSFKAYITGEGYDMVPKTPEWAQAICGVPADTIRSLAAEIASVDKVNFFCGQSVTKIPAGEQTAQAFYTMAFIMDPENNPLATASGKFEIYSGVLAYMINSVGYSQIAPIAMYQPNDEQGAAARTDEYPLLLFTPHSLRRAHSVNDNVVSRIPLCGRFLGGHRGRPPCAQRHLRLSDFLDLQPLRRTRLRGGLSHGRYEQKPGNRHRFHRPRCVHRLP